MLKEIKKKLLKYRLYILGIFSPSLVLDIFFNSQISDSIVLILGFLWVLIIFSFKLKPRVSFILAAISFGISFIFQFFKQEMIMEKGASWFFVFLLFGLVQSLIKSFGGDGKKN